MEFIMTARSKEQENTDYITLHEQGLNASVEILGGNGGIKNPFHAKVLINNENNAKWYGVIHVELQFNKVNPRYFMPAFMYGRNRGECPQNVPNEFPRLREETKRPSSPWWMVRGDRLSHPVALVYDSDKIYGFSASPYFISKSGIKQQWKPEVEGEFYQYAGYTCSLSKGTVGYTLGYENAPWLFIKSHDVRERAPLGENCFELEPGETVEFTLDLYEFDSKTMLDVNAVIEEVYYHYHQNPRKASDIRTTVADLASAVYKDAWLPEELSYSGQVFEDKYTGGYRYNKIISITWTNGLSVATPMLMAALRLGDDCMRQQALSCIENIIKNSLNPANGLPYEAYSDGKWSVNGWWFDGMHTPGHTSYLIGQSLFYILKAYDYEKRLKNCLHEDWMSFVKEVLMKVEKTKNTDEEYPFILSEKTGAGIEYDSFSGTWCMAALGYYCYLTGDKSHIESLRKSEKHYYEEYIMRMECYGAPLDTDKATDSEGILAYIKAVKFLHTLTGEKQYLEHMRDAICYEFSFKFCYNSPVKIEPLSRIGWSSCGGSVTSIANPHIHPMSSNLVDELLYFVENSEDEYVRNRMMDVIGWGCQTYNTYDREYDYGKKGWMSERFCHCEGLVSEKYSDGSLASTWFCLMPWASGSIIDGLAGCYWDKCFE
ncbi:hypothetical protein [Clostridium beijerinckii]|uniref:Uncharacterized protein n=1 Tax=Clostridium beijerinckii TaxID=1520 RepID=A0AAE5LSB6_CLOBE|nr:hypothetical protein [Clostridium beijerinckii]NSB16985.1 hypothetical protein [Clostridium beijerinckii]OOM27765.1 hypothetical protein CLOBE_29280 [Clostridium beijerinckii]UYZ35836.1 hypothetical protein OD350_27245 [Clostridium beijerinckii]